MPIGTHYKISGTWRRGVELYLKINGTWHRARYLYKFISGGWRLVHAGSITPFVNDFTSPGAGQSAQVPYGAVQLVITVTGGGAGFITGTFSQVGGSAGGTATRTVALTPDDWGRTVNVSVGQGNATFNGSSYFYGGDSGVAASLVNATVSMAGRGGSINNDGSQNANTFQVGGGAVGGTSNTAGQAGNANTAVRGGDSAWAAGGAYSAGGQAGNGSLGSGGGGSSAGLPGVGGNGIVRLAWS